MPSHIALLRGVNVGGHRMVSMADLRALLEDSGLRNGASLLQSGNLVFDGGKRSNAAIEKLLEREAKKQLELETDFFVYDAAQWREIIAANPLRKEADREPGRLVVFFLRDALDATRLKALQAAIPGREVIRASGRQLYIYYPDGQGQSRLGAALTERKLGTRGTARNWNTVTKLGALTSPA